MKRLYLLRHAKSSWKDASLADHERPLAGRGRRAANAMADHLREQRIEPDIVLCSSARRARETLDRIESALGTPTIRIEDGLYDADTGDLVERLRTIPDTAESVMMIGHNPSLEDLALELARPSDARRELEVKYPTGALATLSLQAASWRELARGRADLVALVRPRDLE